MGNSSSSSGDGGSTGSGGAVEGERRRSSVSIRPPGLSSRGLSHRITRGGSNNNAHNHGRSSLHLPSVSLPAAFRTGGSLGLSRSELDARCQPSGLYPSCEWDAKQIRRLIANGHLAARLKGSDTRNSKTDRECPICFMYYPETNVSKCCSATLCTECYLQIKPQKEKTTTCPFCNNPKMQVNVQGGMDEGDVAKREEEEQRVIEATIKSRVSELNGESPGPSVHGEERDSGDGEGGGNTSFGSSLANYNRTRTRTASDASSSNISTGDDEQPSTPGRQINPTGSNESDDTSALQSLAMSPADRRALESEMRAQLSHNTHLRMESEAEEARMRHAQEWYGSNAGIRSRMRENIREARLAELTNLLERMGARTGAGGGLGQGGIGASSSGEEDGEGSLMAGGGDRDSVGLRGSGPRGGASLSRLLRAMETSNNIASSLGNASGTGGGGTRGANLEDLMRLEAAFFLGMDGDHEGAGRTRRSGRGSSARSSRTATAENSDDDNGEAAGAGPFGLGGRPASGFGGSPSRGRLVRSRMGSNRGTGVSSTHLDTAELLMRGVSEEEQLAMAIAMSMQDAQERSQQSTSEGGGGGGNQAAAIEREGEDDDSSSSDSSSSSSSNSSDDSSENEAGAASNDNQGESSNNNQDEDNNIINDGGAVSLDEDEEEVVFSDVAEV